MKGLQFLRHNDGINLPGLTLAAGRTCLGATRWCRVHCYGKKGCFGFSNTSRIIAARTERFLDLVQRGPAHAASALMADVDRLATGKYGPPRVVRLHVSGDITSRAHLDTLVLFARRANHRYGTRCFLFTRVWRLGPQWVHWLADAQRRAKGALVIWFSCDPTSGGWEPGMRQHASGWPRVAAAGFIEDPKYRSKELHVSCQKQLTHGETKCDTCELCWRPGARGVILFKRH